MAQKPKTQEALLVQFPFPVSSREALLLYIRAVNRSKDLLRTAAALEQSPELLEEMDDDLEVLKSLKFALESMYHLAVPLRKEKHHERP